MGEELANRLHTDGSCGTILMLRPPIRCIGVGLVLVGLEEGGNGLFQPRRCDEEQLLLQMFACVEGQ